MGTSIDADHFQAQDYAQFSKRLNDNLSALEHVLSRPGFGVGNTSIGAELEMFLIGPEASPVLISENVLKGASDDRFTMELDRFNLECNTTPRLLAGRPFTGLGEELVEALNHATAAAQRHGATVGVIGILPTLERGDLTPAAMSDLPRYRALAKALRQRRGSPFHVEIDGADPLSVDWEHVCIEGANTSLQLHLRVPPEQFTATYNAAQLATGPVLAASGNSPTFLGHRLWHETRIALFKQAVDDRSDYGKQRARPRVCFGDRWLSGGVYELFEDSVRRHPPLLPVVHDEDPLVETTAGRLPGLHELRIHNSTVWTWNRPVYDPSGHLRIELRALPAGPTVPDMLANSAFLLGLTLALAKSSSPPKLPFELAHDNFYRAAQHGLNAELHWVVDGAVRALPASELLRRLRPLALEGLLDAGVLRDEAEHHLQPFEQRFMTGRTGAQWQLARLKRESPNKPTRRALQSMMSEYLDLFRSQRPVHLWPAAAGHSSTCG